MTCEEMRLTLEFDPRKRDESRGRGESPVLGISDSGVDVGEGMDVDDRWVLVTLWISESADSVGESMECRGVDEFVGGYGVVRQWSSDMLRVWDCLEV